MSRDMIGSSTLTVNTIRTRRTHRKYERKFRRIQVSAICCSSGSWLFKPSKTANIGVLKISPGSVESSVHQIGNRLNSSPVRRHSTPKASKAPASSDIEVIRRATTFSSVCIPAT
jgi:hypothetical protein